MHARPHTKWPVALAFGVAGSLIVSLVVLAFLWPTKTATAHDLPISIAGPAASVTALEDALDENASELFTFVEADDRAGAVQQIERRESYGAIVLGERGTAPEVLTAPAGSAQATQILGTVAAQLQAQLTQQVAAAGGDASQVKVVVTPIVPLSENDPQGSGLMAAAFPMVLGGMLGGVLVSLLVVGPLRRIAALGAFGVAAGLVLTTILQPWFGFLQGSFGLNALAIGLSVAATSSFVVGCASLFGPRGIGIGAVVTLLIGNPLSAATVPWQFIAQPWGAVGQWFVPGASNWLLRSLSYFPDAPTAAQWWVLIGWVSLGLVLTVAGHFRSRPGMHVPEATLEHEATPTHA